MELTPNVYPKSSAWRATWLSALFWPLAFCLLGLLMAHYPMLLTGFARVQTDRFDTRLNNFILEHGYLWLRGDSAHRDFWSPGVFYPAKNTFAYSEILLSVGPFYWLWRWLGLPPDTSYQYWMLCLGVLNFFAAYLPLRKGVRLDPLPAALGAFLFAFGSPRVAHVARQQLLAEFYTPLAILAIAQAFRSHTIKQGRGRTAVWILLSSACVVGQLYACFYLGWFLLLGLLLTTLWALALPEYRRIALKFAKTHLVALLFALAVSAQLLAPMLNHYLQARFDVPKRHYMDVYFSMPSWAAWIYMGPRSWLYGWLELPVTIIHESEPIGMGLTTTVLAGWGLWRERERPVVRLLTLMALTVLLYTITLADERLLCKLQFNFVPGAYAIRACHRAVFITLIPAAFGIALVIQHLLCHKSRSLAFALLVVCILEQGRSSPSYDKLQARAEDAALAARVDPKCDAFFLTPTRGATDRYHVDALWVHTLTGRPTLNGHSGNQPPDWAFLNMPTNTLEERNELGTALKRWKRLHGIERQYIQWIQVPAP